jgi:hypothetical protein
MSYITDLKVELDGDPLTLGYATIISAGGTEEFINNALANKLNALESLEENITSLTPSQILNATDKVELLALTGDPANRVWGVLGMNDINPFGIEADIFIDAFGGGSATLTALAILRKKTISRATQLLFQAVKTGHVQMARAIV